MIINFNNSGNVGIRYSEWKDPENGSDKWNVWFMANRGLESSLKSKQKDRLSGMNILGEGKPSSETVVNAIFDLIDKSRLKENKDLKLIVGPIEVKDEYKELLLTTLEEKFEMKPVVEGSQTPAEKLA